jgi:hypothetical protein
VYQYDPQVYRQLHDEKVAELRRDYQGAQGRRRSSVGRFMESVRSVRGRQFWVRDPHSGQVQAIPFWRLQRLSDPSGDRP